MSADDVLQSVDSKMSKAVEVLKDDLSAIRTGRASPGLVSSIKVDYHGVPMPLNQIASSSAPLTVQSRCEVSVIVASEYFRALS